MKTLKQGPGENSQPTQARRPARGSLGSCAQAQNPPIGAQPRPPSSGFPGFPDFPPVLPWFRGPLERSPRAAGGVAGPLREGPFISGPHGHPLNFRIHAVRSSARKPNKNDGFSPGLLAFWFLWSAGGSVALSVASPFFPRPSWLKKRRAAFCHKKRRIVFFACAGWLVQTASEPFREPFVKTVKEPIDT